ncbi:hypothetical protein DFH06DRAFT_529220 [Mycena polygramma]|nr:hypothetical protein DFH06DRAFT_529220 [Mycena polygramma]
MDILKEHPELAPDVLQILSQALKATQQQVHELLAERASEREESGTLNVEIALGGEDIALATGEVRAESQCCQTNLAQIAQLESDNNDIHHNLKDQLARNANLSEILKTAQTDLLSLNSKYDDEKSAGDQLRAVLESRYLDLRNQEAAVKAQNLAVAEEIKGLQRRKEEWARKELARGTQYDDMAKDRDALQATLNEKISALDAQEDALKRSIRERGGLSKDLEKTCLQLQHAKMRQAESDAAHAAVTRSFEAVQAENVKCKDDFQTLFNAFSLERQSRVQLQRTIEFKDAEAAQVRDDQDARLNTIVKQVRDDLLEQLNRQKAKCRQLGEERKDLLQKYTQREEDYSALDTVRETNMIKLRDENGNLRTTVHTVAARTREQLEQAVEHERGALEAMINNLKEENQQLKNDLNSVRVQTKPVEHTQVQIQPDTVARKLYIDLLSKFAPPRGRPPFRTLDSVDIVDTKNPLQPFAHKFPSNRFLFLLIYAGCID